MAFGDFAAVNAIEVPDVEYIVAQDIAKKVDYTTTVVHRITPELMRGTTKNRFYMFEDVVFRDKRQLRYTELAIYTKELIESLELQGNSALLVDGTGVGEAVYDLYEEASLDPLKIVFGSGESATTQRQRDRDRWGTSRFGSVSAFVVPKVDLVTSLQVYVQQGKIRNAEGLPFMADVENQYRNFVGRINEKTKYVKYGNSSDEIHDDWVVADAMATWYTQHMKRMMKPRTLEEIRGRGDSYRTNPFEEDEEIWQ